MVRVQIFDGCCTERSKEPLIESGTPAPQASEEQMDKFEAYLSSDSWLQKGYWTTRGTGKKA